MSISKFAVKRPTMIMIIFVLLAALGIYCTTQLPLDLYPEMDIPYIIVSTEYSNAGPEEVEKSVTRTLESVLSSVTGLKKLTSKSSTGQSLVIMEFEYGSNLDTATNNIRDKIEIVRNYLPTDSKAPIVFQMDPSMMPIMALVINGQRKPEEISSYVEDVIKPRLEQIDGVASTSISGGREKAVLIDVPKDRLDAYDLTITQIAQMIGAQNITSSGGNIEQGDSNYSISAEGTYKTIEDIKGTVVTYKSHGGSKEMVSVVLKDIADVYQGYEDIKSEAYLNGQPSIMLLIQKQSGKNSVATADKVRVALEKIKKELPRDLEIQEVYNSTDDINNTINQVVESLIEGIILAVVVLYIFLRSLKSTFIIALSIPLSVIITLCLMYFCNLSINMMTLSGLLLGIGMLVDNSIVILENIFSYRERDAKPEVAAVLGSEEMIGSITSSTLTTVCIFLPMILFQKKLGMMGQLFTSFAFTIVFSLICSLFVAAVFVPVVSSKYLRIEKPSDRNLPGILGIFDKLMDRFFTWLDNVYAKGVTRVLKHRKITLGVVIGMFIASIVCIKIIGFVFMPNQPATKVTVSLEMPKGTKLDVTREVMQQYEAQILRDLKGVRYSTLSVGGNSFMGGSASDSNKAELTISLYSEKNRKEGWDNETTAKEKCRKYFNSFPGAQFTFGSGMNSFAQSAIDIVVKSDSLDMARATSKEIMNVIKEKASDYVNETTIDLEDGLPELKVKLDRNRMYELGVTSHGAGSELNAAINGKTASRYDDNGTQIDIIVSLADDDKKKFSDLDNIYVSNSRGKRIPFASFSRYEESFAPVTINRENQTRTIKISVEPKAGIPIKDVQDALDKIIKENVVQDEDVMISFQGSYENMMEAILNFIMIIIMAVLLVFGIMASQFESFRDPFIIIFTIPLSFIGVIMIYLLTGNMLNVVSVVGMLVLVGTIVNNGIVLVDYTNLLRKRGYPLFEACVEAARNRLRPILMSTLTTITSLIPMAFFPGESGAMTQPIGLTVLGGMSFGSCMTLFVMPVIYYIFNASKDKKLAKKAAKKELKSKQKAAEKVFDKPKIVNHPKLLIKKHSKSKDDVSENNVTETSSETINSAKVNENTEESSKSEENSGDNV